MSTKRLGNRILKPKKSVKKSCIPAEILWKKKIPEDDLSQSEIFKRDVCPAFDIDESRDSVQDKTKQICRSDTCFILKGEPLKKIVMPEEKDEAKFRMICQHRPEAKTCKKVPGAKKKSEQKLRDAGRVKSKEYSNAELKQRSLESNELLQKKMLQIPGGKEAVKLAANKGSEELAALGFSKSEIEHMRISGVFSSHSSSSKSTEESLTESDQSSSESIQSEKIDITMDKTTKDGTKSIKKHDAQQKIQDGKVIAQSTKKIKTGKEKTKKDKKDKQTSKGKKGEVSEKTAEVFKKLGMRALMCPCCTCDPCQCKKSDIIEPEVRYTASGKQITVDSKGIYRTLSGKILPPDTKTFSASKNPLPPTLPADTKISPSGNIIPVRPGPNIQYTASGQELIMGSDGVLRTLSGEIVPANLQTFKPSGTLIAPILVDIRHTMSGRIAMLDPDGIWRTASGTIKNENNLGPLEHVDRTKLIPHVQYTRSGTMLITDASGNLIYPDGQPVPKDLPTYTKSGHLIPRYTPSMRLITTDVRYTKSGKIITPGTGAIKYTGSGRVIAADINEKELLEEIQRGKIVEQMQSCDCLPGLCVCPGDHYLFKRKKRRKIMVTRIGPHGKEIQTSESVSESELPICICRPPEKEAIHYASPATTRSLESETASQKLLREFVCPCARIERSLVIIKPEAVIYRDVVIKTIQEYGYEIVSERIVQLSPEQASELHEKYYGSIKFPSLILSISMAAIVVLSIAGIDVVNGWNTIAGNGVLPGEWFLPPPILRRFGYVGDIEDALQSPSNIEAALYQNRFFFPSAILEPIIEKRFTTVDYVKKNVNPTLIKGLTAICRNRPADPILSLAEWLLLHNPFSPHFPAYIATLPT